MTEVMEVESPRPLPDVLLFQKIEEYLSPRNLVVRDDIVIFVLGLEFKSRREYLEKYTSRNYQGVRRRISMFMNRLPGWRNDGGNEVQRWVRL